MKESLEKRIKKNYIEHRAFEAGRILSASIIDIIISAKDAFKFLESFKTRSSFFMRTLANSKNNKINRQMY